MEMSGEEERTRANGEETVNEAVLEQGIQALEGKRKAWYTYLTTKDFWIVVIIG
jgi:solute carrier family 35 protein F1/2